MLLVLLCGLAHGVVAGRVAANSVVYLSGCTNLCFFDSATNLVAGPLSAANLGSPLSHPTSAEWVSTTSSAVSSFSAQ